MLPANLTSTAMSTAFKAGGGMSPAPLASLDAALSRLSPGQGGPVAIALAAVELAIGAAIFRDRWRYAAVLAGCTFALAIWVTVQGLGGLSTGQATDPDTGPLLILTAAALYGLGGVRGGR
jgi:hypothetical protein